LETNDVTSDYDLDVVQRRRLVYAVSVDVSEIDGEVIRHRDVSHRRCQQVLADALIVQLSTTERIVMPHTDYRTLIERNFALFSDELVQALTSRLVDANTTVIAPAW
jgi:predicted MarR family transcription regulator